MVKIDFDIFESYDRELFVKSVRSYLNDGWKLHGPLVVIPPHLENGVFKAHIYLQAFTKETGTYRSASTSIPG